jgi:hypothetical protein
MSSKKSTGSKVMGAVSNAISGGGAAADKKSKSKAVTQSSRAGLQVS